MIRETAHFRTGIARKCSLLGLSLIAVIPLLAQQPTLRSGIDLVVVPATVRDENGNFIYDLTKEEFQVLEDGRPQEIRSFTVDQLPLSIAVLIDTGMDGPSLRRFVDSLRYLRAAFKDVDEIEAYRFDHIHDKLSDFTGSFTEFEKKLAPVRSIAERQANRPTPVQVFPGRGPKWLRKVLGLDAADEHHDLNDPLFMAAVDLEKRDSNHRKVVIIISDGQIADSLSLLDKGITIHSYSRTRDRLVQDQIQVYAVAVGNALLEGPTSILHAYADATGGDVYGGRTQDRMETAFSGLVEQARHQYVLGYVSNNEIRGLLPVTRKIEVKVTEYGMAVKHRRRYLQYPRPR